MHHGFTDGNGVPLRHGEDNDREASRLRRDMQKHAASSALRRLVLAAAACDGAAGAAANAADEIAQLRLDVLRRSQREDQRSRMLQHSHSQPAPQFSGAKDREWAYGEATQQRLAAERNADGALERRRYIQTNRNQDRAAEAANKEAERRSSVEAKELAAALQEARSELASARREVQAEAQARDRDKVEAKELDKELRRAQAAAADDLAVLKASEAAAVEQLRHDLGTSRRREALHEEDAREAALRIQSERSAAASQASEAERLRQELQASLAKVSAAEQQRESEASKARSSEDAATQARLAESSMESRASSEASRAQRAEDVAAEAFRAESAMATRASAETSEAQRAEDAAANARCAESAMASRASAEKSAAERASRSAETEEAVVQRLMKDALLSSTREALLLRREQASHQVLVAVLARRLEDLVRGAFGAWREAQVSPSREAGAWAAVVERRVMEEKERQTILAQQGLVAQQVADCKRRLQEAQSSEAGSSQRALAAVDAELASHANAQAEAIAQAAEMERLAVTRLAAEQAEAEAFSSELKAVERLRERVEVQQRSEELLAQEALAQVRAANASSQSATEFANQAKLMLSEGEEAAQQAAKLAARLVIDEAQQEAKEATMAAVREAQSEVNAARQTARVAEERLAERRVAEDRLAESTAEASRQFHDRATSAHLRRREAALGSVLATLLAADLEHYVHAAFSVWLDAVHLARRQVARGAESEAQQIEETAAVHALQEQVSELSLQLQQKENAVIDASGDLCSLEAEKSELAAKVADLQTQLAKASVQAADVTEMQERIEALVASEQVECAAAMEVRQRLANATASEAYLQELAASKAASNAESHAEELARLQDALDASKVAVNDAKAAEQRAVNKLLEHEVSNQHLDGQAPKASIQAAAVAEMQERLSALESSEQVAVNEAKAAEQKAVTRLLEHEVSAQQAPQASTQDAVVAEMQERLTALAASEQVAHTLVLRREEATRHLLTSVFAAQWELLALGVFIAWRQVCICDATASEAQGVHALLLRREEAARHFLISLLAANWELFILGVFNSWRQVGSFGELVDEVEQTGKPASIAPTSDARTEAVHALLLRREEAARRMLASFFAAQWELFALGAFSAWRQACSHGVVASEVTHGVGSEAQQTGESAAVNALQEQISQLNLQLQQKETAAVDAAGDLCGLESDKSELAARVADLQAQLAKAQLIPALLQRREEAARRALTSFFAAQWELFAFGVLSAWRQVCVCGDMAKEAEHKKLEDDLREREREIEDLQDSNKALIEECSSVNEKFNEVQAEARALRRANSNGAAAAAVDETRRSAEKSSAEAVDICKLKEVLRARQQDAALGMLSVVLARELEALVTACFSIWCDALAVSNPSVRNGRDEARGAPVAPHCADLQEAFRAWSDQRLLGLEALLYRTFSAWAWVVLAARGGTVEPSAQHQDHLRVLWASRREEVALSLVATLLARQLELTLRGAFSSWCLGVAPALQVANGMAGHSTQRPSCSEEPPKLLEAPTASVAAASSDATPQVERAASPAVRSPSSNGDQDTHWDRYHYDVDSDPEL